jgi:phosphoribosylformylglycinamidine synthase
VSWLSTETCFYIELDEGHQLSAQGEKTLLWILTLPFDEQNISKKSFLEDKSAQEPGRQYITLEIGPRLNFSTAWSTNAVSICHSVGLIQVKRIEESLRYLVGIDPNGGNKTAPIGYDAELSKSLASVLHDKMTQCIYEQPLESFDVHIQPSEWFEVDLLSKGRSALEKVNKDLGLAFDDWDLDYYSKLFSDHLKRNPTSVECFDLAQSNSEHSRHWFFRGKMVIDGEEIEESLMDMVKQTNKLSNENSVIRLADNSR